jgi:AcrR family transcriptional regulator
MIARTPRGTIGRARGSERLSRGDWIAAGQALLCDEGIAGMRLMKLTKRLRVSTGSFYHHFADMDEYLAALAEYYKVDQVQRLVDKVEATYPDPYERIRQMAIQSMKTGLFKLDLAMRVWAASDERAASSMQYAERVVLGFLTAAFAEAGFDRADAELRARIQLSVTVASLVTHDRQSHADVREKTLRFLLETPALPQGRVSVAG